MIRFLHAADIHLDSPLTGLERYEGAPVDEIRSATRRAFDNLIQLAIDEAVDFVLLAGDLYDGDWKDYNTGLYFIDRMRRLAEAGIRVFLIAGNHDAASQITRHLRLPDNVKSFSTRKPERFVLDDLQIAIHGQGFARRSVLEDLSQGYPTGDPYLFNIGMLHTGLGGRPGHEPYAPCTLEGLRSKGYQYWALGHVHRREVVTREPWIVFPGNIQGRHVRETGPKGCALVTVDEQEVRHVEHRDLDVLRWSSCSVDLASCDRPDEVYESVRESLRQSLENAEGRPVAARLILHGACAAHTRLHAEREYWLHEYRALASGLGGSGVWLEKIVIDTRSPGPADPLFPQDDALGGLLRGIRELELDDGARAMLGDEIADLRQKLPAELLTGEDRWDPDDPARLRKILEDVKALLVDRLLDGGDG